MLQTDIGAAKYGMARLQAAGADVSAAAAGAVTTARRAGGTVENPMMWLLGIGAVTLGLVAFSTSVRVGSFHAAASAG